MQNNFSRVLALVNCCRVSHILYVFTPLYRGVKETLWNSQHIKKSRLKLDQITNDLLPDMVIVLWRINFKSISSLEEYGCRHSCCFCLVAETKQSNGGSGCTIRTIVLFQRSLRIQHPSNPFELAIASLFWSSAILGVIKSFEQHLKL
jgi:hypothetical protein